MIRRLRGQSSKKQSRNKKKKSGLNCLCVGFPEGEDDTNKPIDRDIEDLENEQTGHKGATSKDIEQNVDMGKTQSKEKIKGQLLRSEPKLKNIVASKLEEEATKNGDKAADPGSVVDTNKSTVRNGCQEKKDSETIDNGTNVDVVVEKKNERESASPIRKGLRRKSTESSDGSERYESCGENDVEALPDKSESMENKNEVIAVKAGDSVNDEGTHDGKDEVDSIIVGDKDKVTELKDSESIDSSEDDPEPSEVTSINTEEGTENDKNETEVKASPKKKYPLKKMQSKLLDAITYQNFESFTPEACIDLMKNANLKFLSSLNKKLKQKNKEWNEEFLDLNGAQGLLDLVDTLGIRRVTQLSDALLLLECIQCIKTIMNSKTGLGYLVEHGPDLNRLVRGES